MVPVGVETAEAVGAEGMIPLMGEPSSLDRYCRHEKPGRAG